MFDFESEYSLWRESKLCYWPNSANLDIVLIQNPSALTDYELKTLHAHCEHNNFSFYRFKQPNLATKDSIRSMSSQLGMVELDQNLCADNDKVSSLQFMKLGRARGYIPYTTKALNWHTDGYYNQLHQHIRSFLLHSIQNALLGGENILLNHDLIYIHLYDEDPALITALMQPDALTIPANIENDIEIRPEQTGPVFYRDPQVNTLQMRYTARSRNIQWKQDATLIRALKIIEELLQESDHILRYTLQPGEGIICNNILHGRSAFTNGNIPDQQRVMYRVRSYNKLFSDQVNTNALIK